MEIGRIIEARRTNFIVRNERATFTATVRGTFHTDGDFPKVGDYVEFDTLGADQAVITKVRPRTSVLKRKAADSDEEQIMATNIDLLIIVMGLDGDFNLSRLERYLLLAEQSGIAALVLLNKADLATDLTNQVAAVQTVTGSTPVVVATAIQGQGLNELREHLPAGTTAVLLGSSGAGKSTITNRLLGTDAQEVQETREDDSRGRHTTTSRQLFALQNGAFLIDTPGIRELGVLESDLDDQRGVFAHIEDIAADCRFRNCDHEKSAGCAVIAALEQGELSEREWQNYQKLVRERSFLEAKEVKAVDRYTEQNQKRSAQKHELMRRRRLSGG